MKTPAERRAYMRDYMRRYRERGPMQRDRWTEARLTEPYAERKRRAQEARMDGGE